MHFVLQSIHMNASQASCAVACIVTTAKELITWCMHAPNGGLLFAARNPQKCSRMGRLRLMWPTQMIVQICVGNIIRRHLILGHFCRTSLAEDHANEQIDL